jgi:signal transduction histidine kinase
MPSAWRARRDPGRRGSRSSLCRRGDLQDRARRLELERDRQGRLSAASERARIAREMHDIVAHNLSVMTTLAWTC